MRGSGTDLAAGLVLAACLAAASASAAGHDPAAGGPLLLAGAEASAPGMAAPLESPAAAAPASTGGEDETTWGVLLRGGYFGVPDFIADELFLQHPEVEGESFGAELRYHGAGGGRGVASIGIAIDSATANADGIWQENESEKSVEARGEISMIAVALTGYWSLFPSWYVHPYVGLGIGFAHARGYYYKVGVERVDADVWIPVVHVPVGVAVELGKYLQLAVEGRFVDGIAIGGALQVRF